jgi:membrane associated rhomboid family serine protease
VAACTALSVFVWILELSGIAGKHPAAAVLGLSATGVFRHFYFFEMLTAPLLHNDWRVLVFNMLTLYSLGPPVERLLGKRRFVELSAAGVGASSLAFLFANLFSGAISVGYNGGVLAVLLAQAIYFPERQLVIYGIFPLRMRLGALLIGLIAFLSAPART